MAPDQASTFEFLDAQQRPQNSRANAWRSSIRDTFTKGNFFIRPIPFRARAITFIAALISRNIPSLPSSVSTLTRKRMAIATWMTPMHTGATSLEGTSGYNNT